MTTGVGGHPQAEQLKMLRRVRQKMRSDRRLTVKMIAGELGMNSERV